jgi:predicted enzyme related to lactoylglutathione lyase
MTVHGKATDSVSGAWRRDRPPQSEAGILVYVNVDDFAAAMATVEAPGGEIVQDIGSEPGELTSRFRDPYGNLVALYQEPTR